MHAVRSKQPSEQNKRRSGTSEEANEQEANLVAQYFHPDWRFLCSDAARKGCEKVTHMILESQNFEYKISSLMFIPFVHKCAAEKENGP